MTPIPCPNAPPLNVRACAVAATIMLGSNDHVVSKDVMHVPVEEYRENLEAIVRIFRERYPSAKLLLMTPPPCDGDRFKAFMLEMSRKQIDGSGRGLERLAPYVAAVKEVAAKTGATLVNVHAKLLQKPAWKVCKGDGARRALPLLARPFPAHELAASIRDVAATLLGRVAFQRQRSGGHVRGGGQGPRGGRQRRLVAGHAPAWDHAQDVSKAL